MKPDSCQYCCRAARLGLTDFGRMFVGWNKGVVVGSGVVFSDQVCVLVLVAEQ